MTTLQQKLTELQEKYPEVDKDIIKLLAIEMLEWVRGLSTD